MEKRGREKKRRGRSRNERERKEKEREGRDEEGKSQMMMIDPGSCECPEAQRHHHAQAESKEGGTDRKET